MTGIEVDILKDGRIDLPDDLLAELDVVIASLHQSFNQTEAEITQRLIGAAQNRYVHMLGHLKIFLGEAAFNDCAVFLREMEHPLLPHEGALWIARVVLLACVAFHRAAALQLTLKSRAARPIPYEDKNNLQATYAARTMRWGGVIIGLFVIYHLLHFTLGVVGYQPGQFEHLSVYRNVVTGFSGWYVSLFYIVAMGMLGFHLYHGVWSLFQTLGARDIRGSGLYRGLAGVLAWR